MAAPNTGEHCLQILVVDDAPEVLQLLQRILEQLGHAVVTANSGEQALKLLNEYPADVIFSDISMGEMNGYELVQHLRCRPDTRMRFVIAMTGNGEQSSECTSLKAGFDAHLAKPFGLESIHGLLTAFNLRRTNSA